MIMREIMRRLRYLKRQWLLRKINAIHRSQYREMVKRHKEFLKKPSYWNAKDVRNQERQRYYRRIGRK